MDKVIGNNLVDFRELNLRRKDGTVVGYAAIKRVEEATGFPWWTVHRHHLHNGLVEIARQNNVKILISHRVGGMQQLKDGRVSVTTQKGAQYTFDLIVGSDGLRSFIRNTLFPKVKPRAPTTNAAFRAVVPYDVVRRDPLTRGLVEDENGHLIKTMEVWMAPTGYVITYPISNANEFNMVLSHFHDPAAEAVEEVSLDEVKETYKDYDPRIRRVIDMIDQKVSRWPLMVTGPLESWSNPEKNVVLMGDAAHSAWR